MTQWVSGGVVGGWKLSCCVLDTDFHDLNTGCEVGWQLASPRGGTPPRLRCALQVRGWVSLQKPKGSALRYLCVTPVCLLAAQSKTRWFACTEQDGKTLKRSGARNSDERDSVQILFEFSSRGGSCTVRKDGSHIIDSAALPECGMAWHGQ
ncbi:uncharacterized protein BKA78DRAFT_170942 [Phyllosticta capitalensis]|uniref:uncharacterized protein n=1 Tax=Phyllosticta capitalensis TaxID=121624 RepID=UPI00312CE351